MELNDLFENRVIKLGGFGDRSRAKAFIQAVHEGTTEHPFSRSTRIHNNGATVEMSLSVDGGNRVRIHDVVALLPQGGHGSALMQWLCDLADEHCVILELTALAYLKKEHQRMTTEQLIHWYERFGFEAEEDEFADDVAEYGLDMVRRPR